MVSERAGPAHSEGVLRPRSEASHGPGSGAWKPPLPREGAAGLPLRGHGGVQPCPPQADSGRRLGTHGLNQENASSKSPVHPWP